MIALIQRVTEARVAVDGETVGATGRFGPDMQVSLVNDGPVTFWLQASPSPRS